MKPGALPGIRRMTMPFAAFFQTYDEFAADAAPIGLFGWQHIGLLLLTCL